MFYLLNFMVLFPMNNFDDWKVQGLLPEMSIAGIGYAVDMDKLLPQDKKIQIEKLIC